MIQRVGDVEVTGGIDGNARRVVQLSYRGGGSIGGGSDTPKGDAHGPSTRCDGGTTP